MKTQLLVITIFFLTIIVYGQQSKNLSEQMWERVQPCYSMFEDYDEDGKIDYDELIDDSKNGYLKISGSYPTCGCSCTHTVGAYKGNDGKYTFVEEEEWTCSWTKTISSNKDLSEIFPNNFGINTFIPRAENTIDNNVALFYLDIEIPRVGTDTEVSIKVIPFGLYVENDGI
ncbi:MAG: hypothetical protein JW866_07030, partial [Ignavibacteriales bacterium]|nr:hypothetical protein [Ignavibacteriales bacterium]